MSGLTNHLIIFAKDPRLGRVKTRLGRDIAMVNAWAFYRRCLMDTTRRMAADPRWRTWLALTPDGAERPPQIPSNVAIMYQGTGDLGTRMGNAMVDLAPGPTIIIGTDIPGIRRPAIADAFHQLGRSDTVFGPATDGGYWLVGCRRHPRFPQMFDDVRWSTEHALSDTVANVHKGGFSAQMLNVLEDVDDAASYGRWRTRPTAPS